MPISKAVRVVYQTLEFEGVDIHLRTLRDTLQFEDDGAAAAQVGISSATWPIFGVLWPCGRVLAHLMLDHDIYDKRILEVGCGVGLASLVLHHRDADITATDRHPEAEHFLEHNLALNGGGALPFVRTSWADPDCEMGDFDLLIGSDILYQRDHADALPAFIDRHARATCEVIIIDPGRGERGRFNRAMQARGFSLSRTAAIPPADLDAPFAAHVLTFSRREDAEAA